MIVDNHQYNSPLRPNQHRSGLSYHEKILFFLGSLFVVVGILTLLEFKFKIFAQFTSESNEVNENVLAAHDLVPYTQFQSNLRYVLNNSAEVLNGLTISGDIEADGSNLNLGEGEITASNVVYGITAGEGITITGGQNPIISLNVPLEPTTGVSSIEDLSGTIDLEAGGNISISKDGNKLTISGSSMSDTNTTYSAGIGLELNGTTFNVDFNGIGLQDTASSAASGASIIGVYTGGFTNITTITPGASLQTVLETIDSELSIMGGGGITAVGNISSGNAFTSGTPGSNLFIADTGWIGLGSGAGRIVWSDDTTDEISVLGARLGVGLLNPSYELDVAGNIRAGTDIYIGSTALTSTGGAGTLGVDSSSIIYSSASNIQQVLEDLDTAINNFGVGGSGVLLDGGSYAYLNPALATYLGNNASGGTNKLNGAYFSDNSLLSLGTDNDFRMLFNGTNLILGDTSNTFLSIGDSGTTGNFDFNNGQFYIRGDGNLGIGTTSPNAKVEVNSGSILQTAGQPVLIGSTTLSDTIYDIQIVNKYAYVATGSDGNDFHVVDISDPRAPIEVGALAMNSSIYGLQVMGQYVYAVTLTSNNAFHVIDISDPTNPVEVATLDLIASNANAQAIEVQGKYAYVGTGSQTFFTEEFVIIDISDPINPVEVGSYNLPSTAIRDIHVQGKYAYVNSWDALYVFDISDPTNPVITDSVESDTITRNSYVDGKYAYITNNNSEVVIIDITDPYNLSEINTITLPSTTGDVYVAGGYLYVGLLNNGANELYVYDISSISSPQEIASLNLSQGIISMYVQGKYLYAGIAGGPFYVIDITGIEASSANIGTIATNQIDINDSVYVGNQVFIKNGLHVGGGGASIGGNFSIGASYDLSIGNIRLGGTGGAGLIGVNTSGFGVSTAPTVQGQLAALNAAVSGIGGSPWTDAGSFLRPTTNEYLGNMAVGSTGKLAGAYFADNALLTLGTDNDFRMLFNGTNFLIGDSANTFLAIEDSGTTGNFNFNNGQMYLRGDGNVGIGTTFLNFKLNVNGDARFSDGTGTAELGGNSIGVYAFGESTGVYGITDSGIAGYFSGNSGWAGYFSGNSYFSGNVGIGTSSQQYTLDVAGNIRAGTELFMGNIGLNDTGSSSITSGASLIGVNTAGFGVSTAPTVQGQLSALNASISSLGSGPWTDVGSFLIPASGEYLGNIAVGGTGKLSGAYFADNSLISLGTDNDFRMLFNGTNFILGDTSNTFLSIGDSGTTGNFNFNNGQFYVRGDGNIGIGNINPSMKLDVTGTFRADTPIRRTDYWTRLADTPSGVGGGGTTDADLVYTGANYIYVIDSNSGEFWRYDISTNSWTTMTSPPSAASYGTELVYTGGDYIYAVRGGHSSTFWRYSISGNSWSTMASLPSTVAYGTDLVYTGGNYIYATLGNNSSPGTAAFYRYSISGDSWTSMTAPPQPIHGGASMVYTGGDYIYATRGYPPADPSAANTFFRYSISTNLWVTLEPSPLGFRNGGDLAYANGDYIYAARGSNSSVFYRYSISENKWMALSNISFGMNYGGNLIYGGDGYIYALAGGNSSPTSHFLRYATGEEQSSNRLANAGLLLRGNVALETDIGFFGGNLGIGTTSTLYRLDVAGNIRAGTELFMGDIGLNDTGSSSTTSGASLLGVYTSGFGVSTAPTVQGQLAALNSTVSGLSSNAWTDAGAYIRPTANEYLGNIAIGGTGKLSGLYLADSALSVFGTDNDFRMLFDGTNFILGDTSSTFLSIGDSGTTANFAFNTNDLFIRGDGRVGIGTVSPQALLDVRGDIFTDRYANQSSNTLLGIGVAGVGNLSGQYNTLIGGLAFNSISSGASNTGLGYQAGYSTTTGSHNIAIGQQALLWNQTGQRNVAIGSIAGYSNMTHSISNNVLIGYGTGFSLVSGGNNNTLLGYGAGDNITSGSGNIILGYNIDAPSATEHNQINIGNLIYGRSGNFGINDNNPGSKLSIAGLGSNTGTAMVIDANGDVWRDSSSLRYKDDISALVGPFDKIYELDPVKYRFKGTDSYTIGYVAEDLHALGLTDLVVYDNEGRPDAIKYDRLSLYNLELLKEQKLDIDGISSVLSASETSFNAQDTRILGIQDELTEYKAELDSLQDQIDELFDIIHNSNKVATEEASVVKLTDRVSFLEQMLFGTEASDEASLSQFKVNTEEYPDGEVLGIEDGKLTVEDLTVTGKTNLYDLGVIGDMSVGQLVVRGREATVNSLALPLQIQSQATAEIQLMAGKVVIDTDGNLTVQEEITAKKYNVDTSNDEESSAGSVVIKKGEVEIEIETTSLTESSLIFTSPKKIAVPVATEVIGKNKFLLKLDKKLTQDLEVSWWIVN